MSRNAIIMAAGMSSRFVPLSLETPKALLNVKGEIMIERQIRQLREAGINEIIIVVGYLKEQFSYLKEKYDVHLIENPYYVKMNNFSTLYVARQYLKDTFICSSDNYFTENVFLYNTNESYYSAVYEEGKTPEWCLEYDENGLITGVQIGGKNAWVMKGAVYLNQRFNEKFIPYLEEAFQMETLWQNYWEDLYMALMDELDLYIRKYPDGVIEEFDSIDELRQFDDKYLTCTGSKVLSTVAEELNCREAEIHQIIPVKENGIVKGFQFVCGDSQFCYDYDTGLKKM